MDPKNNSYKEGCCPTDSPSKLNWGESILNCQSNLGRQGAVPPTQDSYIEGSMYSSTPVSARFSEVETANFFRADAPTPGFVRAKESTPARLPYKVTSYLEGIFFLYLSNKDIQGNSLYINSSQGER